MLQKNRLKVYNFLLNPLEYRHSPYKTSKNSFFYKKTPIYSIIFDSVNLNIQPFDTIIFYKNLKFLQPILLLDQWHA